MAITAVAMLVKPNHVSSMESRKAAASPAPLVQKLCSHPGQPFVSIMAMPLNTAQARPANSSSVSSSARSRMRRMTGSHNWAKLRMKAAGISPFR